MSYTPISTSILRPLVVAAIESLVQKRKEIQEQSIQFVMEQKSGGMFGKTCTYEEAIAFLERTPHIHEKHWQYNVAASGSPTEERLHELVSLMNLADMESGLVDISSSDAALLME